MLNAFLQRDWKRYIVEKLEGKHTFPKDFESAAEEELKTEGLKPGMHLEIMDSHQSSKNTSLFSKKL